MANQKKNFNEVLKARETENAKKVNGENGSVKLDDTQRVKILSPGRLVFKRFIRNRLAVVGSCILIFMFLFSFVGTLISPYGQTQSFIIADVLENYDYARASERLDYVEYNIAASGVKIPTLLVAKSKSYISVIEGVKDAIQKLGIDTSDDEYVLPGEKLLEALNVDSDVLKAIAAKYDVETKSTDESGKETDLPVDEVKTAIVNALTAKYSGDENILKVAEAYSALGVITNLYLDEYFTADRVCGIFMLTNEGSDEKLFSDMVNAVDNALSSDEAYGKYMEDVSSALSYNDIVELVFNKSELIAPVLSAFGVSYTPGENDNADAKKAKLTSAAKALAEKFYTDSSLSAEAFASLVVLIDDTTELLDAISRQSATLAFVSALVMGSESEDKDATAAAVCDGLYKTYTGEISDYAEKLEKSLLYSEIVTRVGADNSMVKILAEIYGVSASIKMVANAVFGEGNVDSVNASIKALDNALNIYAYVRDDVDVALLIANEISINTDGLSSDAVVKKIIEAVLNDTTGVTSNLDSLTDVFDGINKALGIGTVSANDDIINVVASSFGISVEGKTNADKAKAISLEVIKIIDDNTKLNAALANLDSFTIAQGNDLYRLERLGDNIYQLSKYIVSDFATITTKTAVATVVGTMLQVKDGHTVSPMAQTAITNAIELNKDTVTVGDTTYTIEKEGKSYTVYVTDTKIEYASGKSLSADEEAVLLAGYVSTSLVIDGTEYLVSTSGDSVYTVDAVDSVTPAMVFSKYNISYVDIDNASKVSNQFAVSAMISAYTSHEFNDSGNKYYVSEEDGSVVIRKDDSEGELFGVFATFVVSKSTGLSELTLEFKQAIEEKIHAMEAAGEKTGKTFAPIEVQNKEDATFVVDENGNTKYESVEVTITRKANEYYITCPYLTTLLNIYGAPFDETSREIHIFGTDGNGYDVLERMMSGGRISLIVGFVVVIIETILGVIMGGIAGYFGGWVDTLIMRIVEIFYCIPSMPIMIIMGAFFDAMKMDPYVRLMWLMVILGILGWAGVARLVRGQILSLREQEFMVAAEATGIKTSRKIFRHLIPNVMPQLIVLATGGLGGVILTESTLSFLGLGVKHPLATWGTMINSVSDFNSMVNYAYIWVPVGCLICLTVIAFNFVGDGLRDAFDPKMKR